MAAVYDLNSSQSVLLCNDFDAQERELKLRRQLDKLRAQRDLLRQHRRKRQFPIVAVVGYTNAGYIPTSTFYLFITIIVVSLF